MTSFSVVTAETPIGALMLAETSDEYSHNMAREYEQLSYEQPVVDVIRASDADLFIDGGAGFGYFSLLAASAGKRVLAFEPHPVRYGYLWWNTKHHPFIESVNQALADQVGDLDIMLDSHVNGLMCSPVSFGWCGTRVRSTTVDSALSCTMHRKALIKIDVEGFEGDVLRGATDTLRSSADWIIEFHPDLVDVGMLLQYFPNHDKQVLHSRDRYNTITYLLTAPKD